MPIAFSCPCGKQFRAADDYAGKNMKCPVCGTINLVPRPASTVGEEQGFDLSSLKLSPGVQQPVKQQRATTVDEYEQWAGLLQGFIRVQFLFTAIAAANLVMVWHALESSPQLASMERGMETASEREDRLDRKGLRAIKQLTIGVIAGLAILGVAWLMVKTRTGVALWAVILAVTAPLSFAGRVLTALNSGDELGVGGFACGVVVGGIIDLAMMGAAIMTTRACYRRKEEPGPV